MTIQGKQKIEEELKRGHNLSVINLVNHLVLSAQSAKASDIHVDAKQTVLRVRLRIDGVLRDFMDLPKQLHLEIISRIKILSNLRTDEHQTTQDGRFRLNLQDGDVVDVRVAITPTHYGESAVLRLLNDDTASKLTLDSLGFSPADQAKITSAIKSPYGMILATGPTGSGKTTSLYSFIKLLNKDAVSIVTIEDPIEYAIDNIKQIPVNARTGLTFANGLRSILRQDPDIIMVGEIRDEETAALAVNTALTGHLVLSTLHTNDAATTLPRLLDMKAEPYLVASTVNVAIGQRLVRKICEACKKTYSPTQLEWENFNIPASKQALTARAAKKFYKGTGCDECNSTGYKGRVGIYEVMTIDTEIRNAILRRVSADEIKQIAIKNGMTTMVEDGFAKAAKGITTIEEILRVIHE